MKKSFFAVWCSMSSIAILAGCGQKEESQAVSAPVTMPSMEAEGSQSADTAAAPVIDPNAPDLAAETAGQSSPDTDKILQVLSHAVVRYHDPGARPGAGDVNLPDLPPLKDVSDLVRMGFLRSIPPPPPGKMYVIDHKNQRVTLADK